MDRIETERLILRPWREDDAGELFRWASDPEVGPCAGWPPHKDVEDSRNVLRTILIKPDTWAVTLRGSDEPVGSIGFFPTDYGEGEKQPEIGYWIARPLWGKGYIPEAVRALVGLCFADGAEAVWCAHYVRNMRSRRVIEKCGFVFRGEKETRMQTGETRLCRYYSIRREDWTP